MLYEVLRFGEAQYPKLLAAILDPPSTLYVRGRLPVDAPAVAIVGTRKATSEGRRLAEAFASELARAGLVVVSGLALGIDTAAHNGALSTSTPTVAVLGNAIDGVYPGTNRGLANKIIKHGGAIVSEWGPGEETERANFIHRNRIISGFSLAVLVIEAPERSGALATARYAAEQGRDVFVLPGRHDHENYVGSHQLIRDGAVLVRSVGDILEDLRLT